MIRRSIGLLCGLPSMYSEFMKSRAAFAPALSWSGVPQRTEANRRSLEGLRIPKNVLFTFLAIDWFNAVKQFRDAEAEHLCEAGKFESTLDEHSAAVSQLISQGENLALAIKKSGLIAGADFALEDIVATIGSLRETFRGVHGPHNHPKTNEAIMACLEGK
jgi:hypothetical protein